ncbi:primase C-terminal domain-containing protein, partial [Klebsiella quasipneumoniae]
MLFEALRIWAYKNFMHDDFYSILENHAQLLNSFEAPLGSNEVNTIVRSVYGFVNKNFSAERLAELKSERARQSGLKGG